MTQKDPVCLMEVEPGTAAGTHTHAGTTYYFCSDWCVQKFKEAPDRYLAPAGGAAKAAGQAPPVSSSTRQGSEALYTCPMHPGIRQKGPGACPICGMALEPVAVDASDESDPELADMAFRLKVAALLTAPVLVLSMGEMIPGLALHTWMPDTLSR